MKISKGNDPENSKALTMSGLKVDTIDELGLPWNGADEISFLTQIYISATELKHCHIQYRQIHSSGKRHFGGFPARANSGRNIPAVEHSLEPSRD